ncbi:hypothetical protein Tco_0006154 [Tanacetum coccineum]
MDGEGVVERRMRMGREATMPKRSLRGRYYSGEPRGCGAAEETDLRLSLACWWIGAPSCYNKKSLATQGKSGGRGGLNKCLAILLDAILKTLSTIIFHS